MPSWKFVAKVNKVEKLYGCKILRIVNNLLDFFLQNILETRELNVPYIKHIAVPYITIVHSQGKI